MIEQIRQYLQELTAIDAISGDERPVVRYLAEKLTGKVDEVTGDTAGNLFAVRKGPQPGPTVLVAAHMDRSP